MVTPTIAYINFFPNPSGSLIPMVKNNNNRPNILTIRKIIRADVDRWYVPRKEGGRGLANMEDTVNMEVQSQKRYIDASEEALLNTNNEENVLID